MVDRYRTDGKLELDEAGVLVRFEDYSALEVQAAAVERARAELETRAAATETARAELESAARDLSGRLAGAEEELRKAQASIVSLREQVATANAERDAARAEINALKWRIAAVRDAADGVGQPKPLPPERIDEIAKELTERIAEALKAQGEQPAPAPAPTRR